MASQKRRSSRVKASAATRRRDAGKPAPAVPTVSQLRDALRVFAAQRDWDQFHTPKNLAAALSVEAAELLEHFQWLSAAESTQLSPRKLAAVREEIADVLLYLLRLADKLDVDVLAAAADKLRLNAEKYPVAKSRGSHRKYTEL